MDVDSAATSSESLLGSVIDGKYRIEQRLGVGATGVVFLATHLGIERKVAVKILHRHLVTDQSLINRYRREAKTASKIEHPNVVTIFDFGVYQERPYLVMEYHQGHSLRRKIDDDGPFSAEQVAPVFKQICNAVAAAHTLGILHRDLKPDNIILLEQDDGSYDVRVLDFGLAKVFANEDAEESSVTKTGIVMGTPHYMSPEQALSKPLDERSDVYALGGVLYYMLTGEVPFDASTPVKVILKHLKLDAVAPSSRRKGGHVSPIVDSVVLKALEKKREKRYSNVSEFTAALDQAVCAGVSSIDLTLEQQHTHRGLRAPWLQTLSLWIGIALLGGSAGIGLNFALPAVSLGALFSSPGASSTESPLRRAERHYQNGQYKEALDIAQRLVKKDKRNVAARIVLGNTYAKLYRLDEALYELEMAVRVDPRSSDAQYSLGNAYYRMGRLGDALSSYKLALKANPKHEGAKKLVRLLERGR